jgi:hypothetical protein
MEEQQALKGGFAASVLGYQHRQPHGRKFFRPMEKQPVCQEPSAVLPDDAQRLVEPCPTKH